MADFYERGNASSQPYKRGFLDDLRKYQPVIEGCAWVWLLGVNIFYGPDIIPLTRVSHPGFHNNHCCRGVCYGRGTRSCE